MARKIVVVGGGYGGTLVAKQLDGLGDVTLIDPREGFVNAAACLRALTRPEWAHNAFFAYDTLLAHGTIVRDRVVSADPDGVTLASGARVEADYLVLATGSGYAYPAKPEDDATSIEQQLRSLRETHAALTRAGRVLILGAGPVGLELAGEVKEVWPDKYVVVVDRAERLLDGYLDEVRDELRRQLNERGVELRLGTRLAGLPNTPAGHTGAFTVDADTGGAITADIWFRAFGVRTNTDYLRDGRLTELAGGLVPVTDRLNVAGYERVYALGDIVDLTDPKQASYAMTQALVVADNITAQLAGEVPRAVHDTDGIRRILLPLGTTGGVGQLPTPHGPAAAPLDTVVERKGRDLFTARFAERFA